MAHNKKEDKETSLHGADWEVVSLTASMYAAAPGPKQYEPTDESITQDFDNNEPEFPETMFMSSHFGFPPSKHEKFPIEPDYSEIDNEFRDQDVSHAEEYGNGPNKTHKESCKDKSDDSLHGFQFFFDNGKGLSVSDMEFGEGKSLQDLSLVGEDSVILDAYHAETDTSSSIICSESSDIAKPNNPSYQNPDSPNFTNASERSEENKEDASYLPCEAWWKRKAVLLYNHVKETNTFWSVFVAAAMMGLVILGQRWKREKLQIQQFKLHFRINSEKIGQF
ncbi:ATG8-interacting protein 1-like isoform X2 [Phoenix dactylifera]|uniref:ATG8-interacting protein 1-like isoform X2 n=1 Tax=Phoenix dactylifera TaxID=42345 RepID=A0A8B7BK97_PHODC|nr:ATG8-interacting protein 1-like isoform X2 [Phoenix dactylifera]